MRRDHMAATSSTDALNSNTRPSSAHTTSAVRMRHWLSPCSSRSVRADLGMHPSERLASLAHTATSPNMEPGPNCRTSRPLRTQLKSPESTTKRLSPASPCLMSRRPRGHQKALAGSSSTTCAASSGVTVRSRPEETSGCSPLRASSATRACAEPLAAASSNRVVASRCRLYTALGHVSKKALIGSHSSSIKVESSTHTMSAVRIMRLSSDVLSTPRSSVGCSWLMWYVLCA
mmetsp:Transcript_42263/g.113015  ORF Transcript_42263/g.113015 Transcript_42263/m.113015 type:complete len:232 (-) Transcript_42263:251-946(-)